MNAPASPQPDSPGIQDQLVAYLDGELNTEASRRIEDLLAADPRVRFELQRLERTWDLLDSLPRAQVDATFTRTTVEMIAVRAAEEIEHDRAAGPARRRRAWVVGMGVVLAAAVAGFLAVGLWPHPNDQLLLDLPLVENLEAYRQAGDIESLRQLKAVRWSGLQGGGGAPPSGGPPPRDESLSGRRARVENMSPEEKQQLLVQLERFNQLEPAEQERLRALQAALAREADGALLDEVMRRYHQWLAQRSAAERAELVSQSPSERVERIRQIEADAAAQAARQLEPQDLQAFARWLERLLWDRLDPTRQSALEKLPESQRRREILRVMGQQWHWRGPGRLPLVAKEHLDRLESSLSDKARRHLEAAALPKDKWQLLATWARQLREQYGLGRSGGPGMPELGEEKLKQLLQGLPDSERAWLIGLPAEEMQQRLRWMYFNRTERSRPNPGSRPGTGGDGRQPRAKVIGPRRGQVQ